MLYRYHLLRENTCPLRSLLKFDKVKKHWISLSQFHLNTYHHWPLWVFPSLAFLSRLGCKHVCKFNPIANMYCICVLYHTPPWLLFVPNPLQSPQWGHCQCRANISQRLVIYSLNSWSWLWTTASNIRDTRDKNTGSKHTYSSYIFQNVCTK